MMPLDDKRRKFSQELDVKVLIQALLRLYEGSMKALKGSVEALLRLFYTTSDESPRKILTTQVHLHGQGEGINSGSIKAL